MHIKQMEGLYRFIDSALDYVDQILEEAASSATSNSSRPKQAHRGDREANS